MESEISANENGEKPLGTGVQEDLTLQNLGYQQGKYEATQASQAMMSMC
jgi:hypothetical protein